jgi:hypothetical protein
MRGRGLAQLPVSLERQIAVGRVRIERPSRRFERRGRRAEIGVEILQTKHRRVGQGVGLITDHIDPDSGNVPQPADRHRAPCPRERLPDGPDRPVGKMMVTSHRVATASYHYPVSLLEATLASWN